MYLQAPQEALAAVNQQLACSASTKTCLSCTSGSAEPALAPTRNMQALRVPRSTALERRTLPFSTTSRFQCSHHSQFQCRLRSS